MKYKTGVTGQDLPVWSILPISNRLKIFWKTIFALLCFSFDVGDMRSRYFMDCFILI